MKRGTNLKLKFKMLKRQLKFPEWQVKGLLQAIWDFTTENAPRGDIGRFTDTEILAGIEYDGDERKLMTALVDNGWLDRSATHRLTVHGWQEHAESWLKKKIERSGAGWAEDDDLQMKPKIKKSGNAEKTKVKASVADRSGKWQTDRENGSHPEPYPEPEPNPEIPPPSPTGEVDRKNKFDPGSVEIPPSLDTPQFREAWLSWCARRKKMRKPLDEDSAPKQLAKLASWGVKQAIESIESSIMNGYQGLFEPNARGGSKLPPSNQPKNRDCSPVAAPEPKPAPRHGPFSPSAVALAECWETSVKPELAERLDEESYRTWMMPIRCSAVEVKLSGAVVWLEVPTGFYRQWLVNSYYEQLTDVFQDALKREVRIEIEVNEMEEALNG